jgi:hypothetical protein
LGLGKQTNRYIHRDDSGRRIKMQHIVEMRTENKVQGVESLMPHAGQGYDPSGRTSVDARNIDRGVACRV